MRSFIRGPDLSARASFDAVSLTEIHGNIGVMTYYMDTKEFTPVRTATLKLMVVGA